MFIANIIEEGRKVCNLYFDYNKYHNDSWNPNCRTGEVLAFKIKGKTYAERKSSLYDLALDYSFFETAGLSYGELVEISNFFETNGRRYGLLKEFRENAIC